MSFERLENDHIVCAENNQRAHCRLKGKSAQSHTVINRTAVDLVSSTKFQRVQITDTLSRSLHTRAVARRAPDEERSLTLSYPYQFLQGYYRELTDMNICVVRGLQCRKSLQRRSLSLHFPTSRTLQWNVLWSEQMFHCCFTSPPCSLLTSGWRVLQDPQQNSNIFITPALGLSLTLTATTLAPYRHICYFGRSIIKWIFFPFYLTKGWTVKY